MALITTRHSQLNDDQGLDVIHNDTGQMLVDHFEVVSRGFVPLRVIVEYPVGTVVHDATYDPRDEPYVEPAPAGTRYNQLLKDTNFAVVLTT